MSPDPTLTELHRGFVDPPPDSRPMMRWWWFGPDVSTADLDRQLQAMSDAGIGGVEVGYVYPLASDSPAFLSPEFGDHLRHAAERAHALGLRFDLTLGSGWSFGGPHITEELAAKKLHWERREISAPAREIPISTWSDDHLVAAYIGSGSAQEPPQECHRLPIEDGTVAIPAGSGPRQLLLAYARPTGQVVKRAAAEADGPVLDHYCAAAARAHLEAVGEPLLRAVPAHLIGSVFCDSLEVYGANWTPELPAEFERRRGYPLLPRLHQLIIGGAGSDDLRDDYYRTLTELYEENFAAVIRDWAAAHGVPFRIQGYGTPPASISSFRHADRYEGEGWGWTEITQTRWATSAAHLFGQSVVSSETWTWTHSPSFRATPLDLKGEAHEHLLAGINQFIGHGWPYSPADAEGLGWFFYAAGALDDRNPWWPAMPELMTYLQRLCWVLRQGDPVADVLLYLPSADLRTTIGPEVGGSLDLWKHARAHIGNDIPAAVRQQGWDFDLVDDDALETLPADSAPVLILPRSRRIPEPTRRCIERIRAAGGTVLAVDTPGPDGARTVNADQLHQALAETIAPDVGLHPNSGDIGAVHRRLPGVDLYCLINTGPYERRFEVTPRDRRSHYQLWDPDHANTIAAGDSDSPVPVTLAPYQAVLLVTHDAADIPASAAAPEGAMTELRMDGPWQAQFLDTSDAAVPVDLPHRWEDDPGRIGYSGTVGYQTVITLEAGWTTDSVILDFGTTRPTPESSTEGTGIRGNSYRVQARPPIGEIAEVIVNDQPAGVLWAPPFAIDIGRHLRPGANTVRLLVSNTAANALSVETAIHDRVRESRTAYGQRFTMQDLEHALTDVDSGLLNTPVLRRAGRDR